MRGLAFVNYNHQLSFKYVNRQGSERIIIWQVDDQVTICHIIYVTFLIKGHVGFPYLPDLADKIETGFKCLLAGTPA